MSSGDGTFFGEPIGDPVVLADYDECWPCRFLHFSGLLREALGPVARRIDHVGSTAVPGLPAKPVIDVQVSVDDIEDEGAYRAPIEALGWPLRYRAPAWRFFRPPKGQPRTVHVHVVGAGSKAERERLLFAAYLRAYPERRNAYAELKRELASHFGHRREDYLAGKAQFIAETLRLAGRWPAP